jgi:hypothetical protein
MPDCGAGPAGRPVGAPLAADVLRPARAPAPPYLPKQPGYRKRLKAAALLLAVLLYQLGWTLTVHPDGTSQVTSPDGTIIRSHSPPPRPG